MKMSEIWLFSRKENVVIMTHMPTYQSYAVTKVIMVPFRISQSGAVWPERYNRSKLVRK